MNGVLHLSGKTCKNGDCVRMQGHVLNWDPAQITTSIPSKDPQFANGEREEWLLNEVEVKLKVSLWIDTPTHFLKKKPVH
jgi:hypothetical protein